MNKNLLIDKQVIFRLAAQNRVYMGTVLAIEPDGFWIDSGQLIGEMTLDQAWGKVIREMALAKAVFFVPTSSLMYLIAAQE